VTTMAELVLAQAGNDRPGLRFEDSSWTYAELVRAATTRATLLLELRRRGPFHVGVLLENVPEFPLWLSAAALAGATIVGINPTRRGNELARDITHTDCQLLVTATEQVGLLEGLDVGVGDERVLITDTAPYAERLASFADAPLPDTQVTERDLYLLLFTSGTTGAPKAVRCSQGRLAGIGVKVAEMFQLTGDDVCYAAMPMYHSNALMAGWAPALAGGATVALRRRFSASGFLPDVRRYGVTFFNYVGKPLAYVLATPERPDDAENPLRRVFGNEAADLDIERFAQRFGCHVIDGYGSTEGGANVTRSPDMPPGSLGRAPEGTVVLNAETEEECPPARFDDKGLLVNPDEAIGELVNKLGVAGFEGYWRNDEANAARTRDGMYWTGDLAY
jgi:fatty-acyl-CoA synthase